MFKKGLILLLAVTLASCATIEHQTKVYQGENLITPYSGYLAGWEVSINNEAFIETRMWQHPTLGFADSYIINVSSYNKKPLSYYRNIIDEPGHKACSKFNSHILSFEENEQVLSLFWETKCVNKNQSSSKILHLLMQGDESLYHIQKVWQGNVTTNKVKEWEKRIRKTYLCDTRKKSMPCPI